MTHPVETAVGRRCRRQEHGGVRLRIAFCIDNMNVGGTEMNAVRTARRLVERGVDLRVFSLATEGPLLEQYGALGVPVHFLPIQGLFSRSAVRRGSELAAIVRREGVDVVHAHDVYSNIFAGVWAKRGGAAFIASRRWWEGSRRRSRRWANRLSYRVADRVLGNSPAVADLLVRTEGVRPDHVIMVPNFLDESAFAEPPAGWVEAFATELGLPGGSDVVGSVASLSPVKDHATLLRALAALAPSRPALHVVLVGGDGGSLAALRSLARELGIEDRVRFAGLRANVPSPHYLFDISALTSLSEGLPNSVLEAMAAARPVVATGVGAVADAVADGETGWLVPAGDAGALAARLDALLADDGLRQRMGEAGRAKAAAQYSADAALAVLVQVYETLASRRRGRSGNA
jgi:L-malate glycosyltransferase